MNRITRTSIALSAIGAVGALSVAALVPSRDAITGTMGPDLMALLHARSPGDRSAAALSNKHPKTAALSPIFKPTQQVMGDAGPAAAKPVKVAALGPVAAPAAALAPAVAPAVVGPAAAAILPAAVAPGVLAAAGPSLLPAVAGIGGVALVPAVFGGGGGGGGGGDTFAPAPAVPEPATWLMMIIGFGVIGSALRRRNRIGAVSPRGSMHRSDVQHG